MLLAAVTKASVKGPGTGGLGAAAAAALMTTWQQQGAEAARQLWKQLLLLPPAGVGFQHSSGLCHSHKCYRAS